MPDYFTLEEFRELPQMDDPDKYTAERIDAVAASLTSTIERGVGTSFVPRTFTRTMRESEANALLEGPFVIEVTGVTVSDSTPSSGSAVRAWPTTDRNAVVTYTSGYSDEPPADIKEALMWAVRDQLLATSSNAGIDVRRTSLITDQGTVNYVLPGEDRPTGYPALDAAIIGWHKRLFSLSWS